MKYPLHERIDEIQDLIDEPHMKHSLNRGSTSYLMFQSCIGAIKITGMALESYLKRDADSSDVGVEFLNMFGVFQALYVQQDAVRNLHVALNISYTMDPSIEKIRDIRHDAAGHPTNRGGKKAFNFFNVWNFEVHGLELITGYSSEKAGEIRIPKRTLIRLSHFIDTQKSVFTEVLDNVIETLKEEQVAHRKKFDGNTLTSAFLITDPFFSYIYEAATSPESLHVLGVSGYVDAILQAIDEFKAGLKEREEPDDAISYRYENLDYALQHIKGCFGGSIETHINRRDAYIFANFAEQEIDELKEIATEIDQRYSQ